MSRRMMRYVMPAGDTEIIVTAMGCNYPALSGTPDTNIYIFFEENDEMATEEIVFHLYETGEAVDGLYVGTISDGKNAKHLYWANYFEGFEEASERPRNVRITSDVSEVSDAGGSSNSSSTQGQSEDV